MQAATAGLSVEARLARLERALVEGLEAMPPSGRLARAMRTPALAAIAGEIETIRAAERRAAEVAAAEARILELRAVVA